MTNTLHQMTRSSVDPERTIVFDIEANGLLPTVSEIHCATIINPFTLEVIKYDNKEVASLPSYLEGADCAIAHNGIGYDIPAVERVYSRKVNVFCFDTLVLSRLVDPEGLHSLEDWGRKLKFQKGVYKGGWETFNKEMMEYNWQDSIVNAVVFLTQIGHLKMYERFGVSKDLINKNISAIRKMKYA